MIHVIVKFCFTLTYIMLSFSDWYPTSIALAPGTPYSEQRKS